MPNKIYKILIQPAILTFGSFFPWWAMDHFLFHDKIIMGLFIGSKSEPLILVLVSYIIFVIIATAIETSHDKDKQEKAALLFGKFFVSIVSVEGLIILIGVIVWIISAAIKHL
jgi:hypothetical protein